MRITKVRFGMVFIFSSDNARTKAQSFISFELQIKYTSCDLDPVAKWREKKDDEIEQNIENRRATKSYF